MQLKLKEGVFGFAWNFEDGELVEIFTEELTPREISLIGKIKGDDISAILGNEDVEVIFGDSIEDQAELEDMGLAEVMEFIN
jgi:hypothetical protein